jgi:hypothetical protein
VSQQKKEVEITASAILKIAIFRAGSSKEPAFPFAGFLVVFDSSSFFAVQ